jgi:hypothetical protein
MRLQVDGYSFEVATDDKARDVVHFTLLDGPDPGYGFSVRLLDAGEAQRTERLEELAREFIGSVDPRTGHLPD